MKNITMVVIFVIHAQCVLTTTLGDDAKAVQTIYTTRKQKTRRFQTIWNHFQELLFFFPNRSVQSNQT